LESEELEEAGQVAEEVFVKQLRRRRLLLGLSQAEVAERVVALGGSLYQQTIAKIEAGTRAVRLGEADVLAKALNANVAEMLSEEINAFHRVDYESLRTRQATLRERFNELLSAIEARERELHVAVSRLEEMRTRARVLSQELGDVGRALQETEEELADRDARRLHLPPLDQPDAQEE